MNKPNSKKLQRVHRNLSNETLDALRASIAALVPETQADIGSLVKTMRLATQLSQTEYANLCGISERALQLVEAARGSKQLHLQTATLEKLLRPFGYRLGIVRIAE